MAELAERVAAELENIDSVLARLPAVESLPDVSELELAGVAALVQSFYNGIENIIKQVLRSRGEEPPTGESWHKQLIQMAVAAGVLSNASATDLREYLAFRHFFAHAYAFDIDLQRLEPLVRGLPAIYQRVRQDLVAAVGQTDLG